MSAYDWDRFEEEHPAHGRAAYVIGSSCRGLVRGGWGIRANSGDEKAGTPHHYCSAAEQELQDTDRYDDEPVSLGTTPFLMVTVKAASLAPGYVRGWVPGLLLCILVAGEFLSPSEPRVSTLNRSHTTQAFYQT